MSYMLGLRIISVPITSDKRQCVHRSCDPQVVKFFRNKEQACEHNL